MTMKRRSFLIRSLQGSAGLSLALMLPACGKSDHNGRADSALAGTPANEPFKANAFVHIYPDNTVTVLIKHLEMGQGTYTGLATLVTEELDAGWGQVVCESAPADTARYKNLYFDIQGTGGSSSIANSYQQMREAGAAARHMLVAAAAALWVVPAADIVVRAGVVSHAASKRRASFGELAGLAAQQPVPDSVTLKKPQDFTLIGKAKLPRKDAGKTDGTAIYTQDIQLPGMLTAVVAHPPRFGATLVSVDVGAAKVVAGVVDVVRLDNGVAVLAKTFWQAKKGRDKLSIQWDETNAFAESSDALFKRYHELAKTPGLLARKKGDVEAVFNTAHTVVEASYEFPYLAHAAMEPLNCVVQIREGQAEMWNGCQFQTFDQQATADLLGLPLQQVKINTLFAGGSFGRRANPHADYAIEAVKIAKAYSRSVPIKLVWTREDDMGAAYFRPMNVHHLKAGLDKDGKIVAWRHRIVGQSISAGTMFEGMVTDGIDPQSVEGATHLPYDIANFAVELHTVDLPVPVLWWRSVASTHTAFSTEAFIDELAAAAKQDPLSYRLDMLADDPEDPKAKARFRQVLQLAAEQAGWGRALPQGRSRGIALHKSFNTYVAQVAEVSVSKEGKPKVEKVTCAVDCGVAVNPDIIEAQMEGGIGFGLSPALMSKVTFTNGKIDQSNFDGYQVVRMRDMPEVEVHIVPSAEPPTGVGEPGTPVIAPAVVNALFAATGKAVRRLPLS